MSVAAAAAIAGAVRRAGGFDFASVPGLAVYLDASDLSTITESSGLVSQWDDKSGNDNHVVQGTGSLQPATGVATLNGRNVLTRAGSDWRMSKADFSIAQPFTAFFVGSTPVNSAQWPWSGTGGFSAFSGSNHFLNFGTDLSGSVDGYGDGDALILTNLVNGADSLTRLRGVETASGNTGASGLTRLDVMNRASGARLWGGKFASLLIYEGALTTEQIQAVEAALAAHWGVALP